MNCGRCRMTTGGYEMCPLHGAAPEMLAALEGLLDELGELGEDGGQRSDDARAAIAHARGESAENEEAVRRSEMNRGGYDR